MTGPARFSPVPRAAGPEYLARCAPQGGCWWLAVLDRSWNPVNSKFTDVTAAGPLPGDGETRAHLAGVLAQLGFGAPPDAAWAEDPDDPGAWIIPVLPVTPGHT